MSKLKDHGCTINEHITSLDGNSCECGYFTHQLIQARTEKLKLLAEVRERVIGEGFKPSGFDERYSRQEGDNGHITHYETKKDAETINQHQEYQRTELTAIEGELL